jgi:two-component system phosphate regulon sensor histidine kinase PhoR
MKHLRYENGRLLKPNIIMVPDLPSGNESVFLRALQRLYFRRWILALAILVIWIFVLFYKLPLFPAISGNVLILFGAAFLRHEGIFHQTSSIPLPRAISAANVNAMLEGLPAPVILLDAQGQVLRFNNQAKTLFPLLQIRQHLSAFIRDPDVLEGMKHVVASRLAPQMVRYETRVPVERHMDVTIAWIGPAHTPISGKQAAVLLYFNDLTEQERLAVQRSDFVANASHELRTPLASVLGFIETLQGPAQNDDEARTRFLAIMAEQAQRMARLIDDLLSLSRIEMHQHLHPQSSVDLNDVIKQIFTLLEPVAIKSNIHLHLSPLPEPAEVFGDWDELVQLVLNLAENAIKYNNANGNVWIEVELRGNHLNVLVRDDGIGIAEKHLPRLTERFYRVIEGNGERTGTGLGLAIVKHAVSRHRGSLSISSQLGEGSVFTVTFNSASTTRESKHKY